MIRRSSQGWQFVLMAGALVVLSACSAARDSTATPLPIPTATRTPVPSPTPSPTPEVVEKRIVGYYTSWSIYQRDFQVADIPADKLTHVNSRLHD
jgi:chitinase